MSYLSHFKMQLSRIREFHGPRGSVIDRVSDRYRYPGSQRRHYRVYLPKSYRADQSMPLVMVLHGCQQTHHDIQSIADFDRLADKHKFIVVYPFVTRYSDLRAQNCWGWWRPEQIKSGLGEVEDLWRVVEEVCDEFAVDRKRIHVAGLSSGGGMAVAALTVHAGQFASGAVVAGVAYGERATAVKIPYSTRSYRPVERTVAMMEKARRHDRTPVPLCIVHSYDDDTVDIQAGKNLRDSWLRYFGFEKQQIKNVRYSRTKGVPWTHTRYGKRFGKSIVETIFLEGPDHGWYGGHPGRFSFPSAPHVSDMMWKFFKQHSLKEAAQSPAA